MSELPAPRRQQWADVAKGVCIVLVVLWHVTIKDYLVLPWDLDVPVVAAWGELSMAMLPVRMPLFFLISGLFAARYLERSWPEVWTRRVAPMTYLFVLWTLLHTVVLQLTPDFRTAVAHDPQELLTYLTVSPGNVWFLLALALYVAVARATRRAPIIALAAALVLSAVVGAGWVDAPPPGNRAGLLVNLVWFLLGTRVPGLLRAAAAGRRRRPAPRWVLLVVPVGAFVVAILMSDTVGADRWLGVRPLLGLLGIAAGVAVAVRLSALRRVGPALARLGRQTLPVYVAHLPLVALWTLASRRLVTEGSAAATSVPLAVAYPVVITALAVATCLLLQRLLVAAGGWWLYTAPWQRPRTRRPDVVSA